MSANNNSVLTLQSLQGGPPYMNTCRRPRAGIFEKHLRLLGGLLLLALSTSLVGETRFCIGGDLDHLTPAAVAACEAKLPSLRDAVKQRGAPADWHFVVVCDEAGWKEYTSFSEQEKGLFSGAAFSTDPRLHWTFLRGADLNTEQPQATAAIVSMALDSLPMQKGAPQIPVAPKSTRQYGIAMARRSSSRAISQ